MRTHLRLQQYPWHTICVRENSASSFEMFKTSILRAAATQNFNWKIFYKISVCLRYRYTIWLCARSSRWNAKIICYMASTTTLCWMLSQMESSRRMLNSNCNWYKSRLRERKRELAYTHTYLSIHASHKCCYETSESEWLRCIEKIDMNMIRWNRFHSHRSQQKLLLHWRSMEEIANYVEFLQLN